jgi:hypothetical protein
MELIAEKSFPANYSQQVLRVLAALSMTDMKTLKVVGSSNIRSQLYAGDYDAMEKVNAKSASEIANKLQGIIKAVREVPQTALGDIKIGEVPEWNVFAKSARVTDGKVMDFNSLQSQSHIDRLLEARILSRSEAAEANKLLANVKDKVSFLEAKKSLRFHILRWSPKDILDGRKEYRGRNFTLEEAILSGGMIKIDLIANILDRFTEFSMIYDVFIKGKRIAAEPPPLVESLVEDMIYYENSNPFKALKRLFSILKASKNYELLEKLVPILNSDLGRLYQIIGDLKTLQTLLGSLNPPVQEIRRQIDEMKDRLSNIYQLKDFMKAENDVLGTINVILKSPPKSLSSNLAKLIDTLQSILDTNTLDQVGDILKEELKGKGQDTYRRKFLKKFKVEDRGYSLEELAKISGEPLATLEKVADRGYGAYNTQPNSVRMKGSFKKGVKAPMSMKLSPQQWSFARVYSYIMKNPKHDQDLR